MSQDASRQFLNSSSEAAKYNFFLRGSLLSQLMHEYGTIKANVGKIHEVIRTKALVLPDLVAHARTEKNRLEACEHNIGQREKLEKLKDQYVWAQVAAKENELQEAVEGMVRLELKLEKLQNELEKSEEAAAVQRTKIGAIEEQLESAKEREEPLNEELRTRKEECKKLNEKLRAVKGEEDQLNLQYRRQREIVEDLQHRLDEESQRMSEGNRARRQKLEVEMRQAEKERKSYGAEQVELDDQLRTAEHELRGLTPRVQELRRDQGQARKRVEELDLRIQRLAAASANNVTAYGSKVPQLLRAINQERRWKQKPVGPIGLYVKLKDAKWAGVLEIVFGDMLNAFCVTCHHDRVLLMELKRQTDK